MLTPFLPLLSLLLLAPPPADAPVERVAFGSCLRETRPAPILDAVNDYRPDVFVFLGDNVYADTDDAAEMEAAYARLGDMPVFQRLRDAARLLYVWDDHDYGQNDAGRDWHFKEEAERIMLDFFGEPADSPRRAREGNYDAVTLGPPGRRVQFVLLDTRFFRSDLETDPDAAKKTYVADDSPEATVLGEEQWRWLDATLAEPAEVRVICTSIQLLADEHRFEKWANFPRDRERLMNVVADLDNAIVLSGDRHSGEMSLYAYEDGRVLVEVTASALNQPRGALPGGEPNRFRVGPLVTDPNFGTMTIDWATGFVVVALRGEDGEIVHELPLMMAR